MIIVKIFGGLGNQLFQYYFGKYVANSLNTTVKYDIKTNYSGKNYTSRLLGLFSFYTELEIASDDEINNFIHFKQEVPRRIERKLIQYFPFINKNYIVEKKLHTTLSIKYIKDNCYYDGYWQSYSYLTCIDRIISKEMNIKTINNKKALDILEQIEKTNSISIHVRRGDYLSIKVNSQIFCTCDLLYYSKAINYIKAKQSNAIFYVFSDDLEWVETHFKGNEFIFVKDNSPSEDMFIMSKCKHNIIANSTFSWWAAWLNSNENKIIISPRNWYKGELNNLTKEFKPAQWIEM